MKINSFEDVSKYVEENSLKIDIQASYSLDRIKRVLTKLNNPQDKIKTVHIAGTSGKTSTSYYLAKLLSLNGYKTGLTVSPHLESISERVQVNSVPISEKEFCKNLDEFIGIITPFHIELTYFELFVAFAFWYFEKIKVDYAVVEVGVGGLLDATNTIVREDKICAITDIGLDHMSMLGNTTEEVASQKAGIIQNGNKVFCNKQGKAVMDCIDQAVKSKHAKFFINPEKDFVSFSARNFSLARFVAESIFKQDSRPPLSSRQLTEVSSLIIPGRIERYEVGDKTVILDGAHNAQKVENLLKSLNEEIELENCCFVLALGENKKAHLLEISQAISKFAKHVILTSFEAKQDFRRASLPPGYLKSYFDNVSTEKVFDLDIAIDKALARPEKVIIFTGSLYMIGPVRAKLKEIKA